MSARALKWWPSVMAMEFRKILAYRSDFWVTFLGQTFIQLIIARALWQAIFDAQGQPTLMGFDLEMITLYYLMVPIGSRILTGENIGFLSREIYDGTFTRYLIYPLSFFQYKSLTYFSYSLFYAVQLALLYLLYHIFYANWGEVSLLNLGCGILLFLIATMTYLMLVFMIELIALWADNIWTLMVMLRFFTNFLGGGLLPLDFFPTWAREFLQWTPFPYFLALPVKTIMGLTSAQEMGQGILVLAIWGLIFNQCVRLLWKKGQLNYAGVGI